MHVVSHVVAKTYYRMLMAFPTIQMGYLQLNIDYLLFVIMQMGHDAHRRLNEPLADICILW